MCVEMIARVVSVGAGNAQVAVVEDDTGLHRVSVALLSLQGEAIAAGDWVVVHTGLVVHRVDASTARGLRELRSPATRSTS